MKVRVLTRGAARTHDYRFFGGPQPARWWNDATWGLLYSAESPGMALRAGSGSWQLLIAGIPTERVDVTGSRISVSLLLEPRDDASDDDRCKDWQCAHELLAEWVESIGTDKTKHSLLAQQVQAEFTAEKIQLWFSEEGTEKDDIERFAATLVRENESPGIVGVHGGVWVGGVSNVRARESFLRDLRAWSQPSVLHGFAFFCPYLSSTRDFREVSPKEFVGSLRVLVKSAEEWGEVARPKVYPPGVNPGGTRGGRRRVSFLLGLAGLALITTILWLTLRK